METIAITNWNDIVSPLYDSACSIKILATDGSRKVVDVRRMSLVDKAEACSKEGVTVLMCGAISNIGNAILQDKNIKVLAWIRGSVDEVIDAYLNDVNVAERYSMPGCRGKLCGKSKQFRHHRSCCD